LEIKKFLELNKEYLTNLVEADSIRDKDKIELFLRFYLCKIVEENRNPNIQEQRFKRLDKENFNGSEVENPFPNKKESITQDLIRRFPDLANRINDFNIDIIIFNRLISDFQKSLRFVIDNGVTGLKGSCPKEKQLSHINGIISSLQRCKRSVLR
jgi:hypothetical protein